MTDNTAAEVNEETTGTAVDKAVEKGAEKAVEFITEITDHVPMSYILAAIAAGFIIGVGLILFWDDANEKRIARELEETVIGND